MPEPSPIDAYLNYYSHLAAERRELRGATVLHTPGSPLLGANAAYAESEEGLTRAALWLHARGAPALFASEQPLTGRAVQTLTLGTYQARGDSSDFDIEQVSRLQLPTISALLCAAWGLSDWAEDLSLSLSRALEERREAVWLLAYAGHEPVGALLHLRDSAHLWGVTRQEALQPLLEAAAELTDGMVQTSAPQDWTLPLSHTASLHFSLGAAPTDALN